MTDIQTQYSTGASRQAIEQMLVAAGKDLDHLRQADLALLEDFHTMDRIATTQLADLVEISPGDEVLDAGSGIGGTTRYVAGRRDRRSSLSAPAVRRQCGQRPPRTPRCAGNPRERLRAVGPAVCPANGPAAKNGRRKWRRPATVVATPGAIADRNQGHGDSQRITRPGRIITIRRAKRPHRADRE